DRLLRRALLRRGLRRGLLGGGGLRARGCGLLRSRLARRSLLLRRALGALDGEQFDGALEGDVFDAVATRDRGVGLTVGDVRAEAAVAHLDRLAADRIGVELLEGAR